MEHWLKVKKILGIGDDNPANKYTQGKFDYLMKEELKRSNSKSPTFNVTEFKESEKKKSVFDNIVVLDKAKAVNLQEINL